MVNNSQKATSKKTTKRTAKKASEPTVTLTQDALQKLIDDTVSKALASTKGRGKAKGPRAYTEPANPADAFSVLQSPKAATSVILYTYHDSNSNRFEKDKDGYINDKRKVSEGGILEKPNEACYKVLKCFAGGKRAFSGFGNFWYFDKRLILATTESDLESGSDVGFFNLVQEAVRDL
jgi:hypothetical protein